MRNSKKTLLLVGDIITLYLALGLTILIRYGVSPWSERFEDHIKPFSVIFLLWLIIFYLGNLYTITHIRNRIVLLKNLLAVVPIAISTSVVVFYLFSSSFNLTPKTNLLLFGLVFFVLEFMWRVAMVRTLRTTASPTIMIGNSSKIHETAKYIKDNPHAGYKLIKVGYDLSEADIEKEVQTVVVESVLRDNLQISNLIFKLLRKEVKITSFENFYEELFQKVPLEDVNQNWFIENIITRRPVFDTTKRFLDIAIAVASGIILLPFALIAAIFIKLSSEGHVIFKQERAGKNGKVFQLYKFRTMREAKQGESWKLWTEENDPRITRTGKILRFTHFDEVPQLWNIIRGHISLVGPRPERIELAEKYEKLPFYEIRHVVKPGITGWAQVNFRPSTSLEEAEEKLRYDIYYVKNRSLFLDVLIVVKTIKYVFLPHV